MVETTEYAAAGWQRCGQGRKGLRASVCLLAGFTLLFPGCASWDPFTREGTPQETESLSFMRPPSPEGRQLGLDPQAREIERSLGIR